MRSLHHPNIIALLDSFETADEVEFEFGIVYQNSATER